MRITQTFILTGARAGQTVNLGEDPMFSFVEGKTTLTETIPDMQLLANYLSRRWAAEPEEEVTNGSSDDTGRQGDVPPQSGDVDYYLNPPHDWAGSAEATSDIKTGGYNPDGVGLPKDLIKLVTAIRSLDPADDTLWTTSGKPNVEAVAHAASLPGVSRAEIDAAIPGYTRTKAKE